jgi:predicted methyltransferase
VSIDYRKCLNALSDVIINRPPPLRAFDQIYMKLADMLLQAELIGRWFKDRRIAFIGDGDAIGLSLTHLTSEHLLPSAPASITIFDFDERVVNSVNHFADRHKIDGKIRAELYNVVDPFPEAHWQQFDAFYTNPPWGESNDGTSVCCFIRRGIDACKGVARGCVVIGDHPSYPWTHDVQAVTQKLLLDNGFRVAEMLPEFHRYHLDDAPELTSCCLVVERNAQIDPTYTSGPLADDELNNFYGKNNPLRYRYVRDLTNGGKYLSNDVKLIPLKESPNEETPKQILVHEGRKPRRRGRPRSTAQRVRGRNWPKPRKERRGLPSRTNG